MTKLLLVISATLLCTVFAGKRGLGDHHLSPSFLRGGKGHAVIETLSKSHDIPIPHLLSTPLGVSLEKRRFQLVQVESRKRNSEEVVDLPVILQASPSEIYENMDVVIPLNGISPIPGPYDFVAIYSPPFAQSLGPFDFMDMLNVTAVDTNNELVFQALANLRADYQFGYFRVGNSSTPQLIGLSNIVTMKNKNGPMHVHLALAPQLGENAMLVQFTSSLSCSPIVKYGTEMDNLQFVSRMFNSTTYFATDMCEEIANITGQQFYRFPGYLIKVLLTDLSPGTRYYYQVGCNATEMSSVFSFKAPGGAKDVTRIIAYADHGLGTAPSSDSTVARVLGELVGPTPYDDFLLHFGDISYARGQGYLWDQYMAMIEPVASRVPYMISIGNHEYDHWVGGTNRDPSGLGGGGWHPVWGNMENDSHGECGVPTFHRFEMPGNYARRFYYSFDYGLIHVLQMSSEHDWTVNSPQYKFIEQDLKNVDRNKTPWVIVTAHRPMYTSETLEEGDYKISLVMRKNLEKLINRYAVDLMLTGHYHSYERTCNVFDGVCQKNGNATMHICVGTAGAGLETGMFPPGFPWSVAHANQWGYSRVEATRTSLRYDFILNMDGSIYDTVTLNKA